jgi:hypothetical protein
LGKFGHRRASRCYAGDVEAAPSYLNHILATRDGLSGDPKLRRAIVRLVEEIVPETGRSTED